MAIKSLPLNVHCTTIVGLQRERRYFSRYFSSHSGKASRRDFTGAVTTLSSFSNRMAVFLSSMHTYSISHLTFSSGHSVLVIVVLDVVDKDTSFLTVFVMQKRPPRSHLVWWSDQLDFSTMLSCMFWWNPPRRCFSPLHFLHFWLLPNV